MMIFVVRTYTSTGPNRLTPQPLLNISLPSDDRRKNQKVDCFQNRRNTNVFNNSRLEE